MPNRNVTLVDLSQPMLDRAHERVTEVTSGIVTTIQSDIRELDLGCEKFDVIVSGACLHHLRGPKEWDATFAKLFNALRPGGWLGICDLVSFSSPAIHEMMWDRYGDYLESIRDTEFRDHVFEYIEKEDSPRPLAWQLARLTIAGFEPVEVLHMNTAFAAYGGIKPE